jgi:hypothetical protein
MKLCALILALLPTAPFACARHVPFVISDLADAPIVLRGQVTGFQAGPWDGVIVVKVTEVLQGNAPSTVTLLWSSPMGEVRPEVWDRPTDVILAAALSGVGVGAGHVLISPMCSDANILPDTPENLAAVRAILEDSP